MNLKHQQTMEMFAKLADLTKKKRTAKNRPQYLVNKNDLPHATCHGWSNHNTNKHIKKQPQLAQNNIENIVDFVDQKTVAVCSVSNSRGID